MSDLSPLTTSQLLSILAPIRLPQTTNITPFTSFSFSSTLAPFRSKNSISSPFKFQNWARTFSCSPSLVFLPSTTLHCRLITEYARRTDVDDDAGAGELTDGRRKKKAAMTVRAFGVGHSPSDLACTEEIMVKTTGMDKVVDVDVTANTVRCQPGITLESLQASLASYGLAMSNVGSISEQTLGGVITTATHGSGYTHRVLSSSVESLVLVSSKPGAKLIHCSRKENSDLFFASLCGLGLTGLIVEVVYKVEPAFRLRQVSTPMYIDDLLGKTEQQPSAAAEAADNTIPLLASTSSSSSSSHPNTPSSAAAAAGQTLIEHIAKSSDYTRIWWWPQTGGVIVARATKTFEPASPQRPLLGNLLSYHVTQFLLFLSWAWVLPTKWVGGWAWYLQNEEKVVVDESYKVFCVDCLFPQYTTEWAIDFDRTAECLSALKTWLDSEASRSALSGGQRVHFPIEVRFTAADDIWLSPAYGRRTTYIGIVQYRPYGLSVEYEAMFNKFAEILGDHGGRPHWAKQHEFKEETLRELYPKFNRFCEVVKEVDPEGRWSCGYTMRHFGSSLTRGEVENAASKVVQ